MQPHKDNLKEHGDDSRSPKRSKNRRGTRTPPRTVAQAKISTEVDEYEDNDYEGEDYAD
jgi:hypothetical protein